MTLRVFYSTGGPYLDHKSGLDWKNLYWAFIKFLRSLLCALAADPSLTLPSSGTGFRGTAVPAMRCLKTRWHSRQGLPRLEQVPFPLAVCFFSSAIYPDCQAGPWGSPCRLCFPVSNAITADLAEGWLRTETPVTSTSCALRSSKACFKNHLFRNKNQLCQYMQQPEKVTELLRSRGCPGSECR